MDNIHKDKNYTIELICHSCFLIRSERANIVIDFWKEPDSESEKVSSHPSFLDTLPKDTPLYVIVTHHHKDHFNKNIFSWSSLFGSVKYIISYDVARSVKYLISPTSTYCGDLKVNADDVVVMRPGDIYEDDIIKISAFGSSDIGCSYLIEKVASENFFHAGDLNDWTFRAESTLDEINNAQSLFSHVLEKIKESIQDKVIDNLFFPLDPRLGCSMLDGPDQFLSMFNVRQFYPMHFSPSIEKNNPDRKSNTALLYYSFKILKTVYRNVHFNITSLKEISEFLAD